MNKLPQHRYFTIKGYLNILRDLKPNGRYNHKKAQYVTALSAHLRLNLDIKKVYEDEIKAFIRVCLSL